MLRSSANVNQTFDDKIQTFRDKLFEAIQLYMVKTLQSVSKPLRTFVLRGFLWLFALFLQSVVVDSLGRSSVNRAGMFFWLGFQMIFQLYNTTFIVEPKEIGS